MSDQDHSRFAKKSLSRRSVIRGAAALGAGLGTSYALGSKSSFAQAPRSGGRFRLGLNDGNITDSLNPATYTSTFSLVQAFTHRNTLTEITSQNTLGPELAESWEGSNGAKDWVFHLRKGVEFHNGKAFTSRDVVATLRFHLEPNSVSGAKELLSGISDVRADGDHTVRITLASGNADVPYFFTEYTLVMLPSNPDGTVDWQSGSGTGAYIIKEFQPGVRCSLVKNSKYFKQNSAHFEEVELMAIPDASTRQSALLNNEIDAMSDLDLKFIGPLSEEKDTKIFNLPSASHINLPMHMDVPPFNNVSVRRALKHSIDRKEIVSKILNGFGTVANDHPIAPNMPFYAADVEQTEYNPDLARHLLAKAGIENLSLDLHSSNVVIAGGVDLALLFQQTAAPVGIKINVIQQPADSYWSNVWNKVPFCVANWGGRPTPDMIFSLAYASGASWNDSHFEHERFNTLLRQARVDTDQVRRGEIYREMQIIMRDDGATIIPFFRNRVFAARSNVMHGPDVGSNWPLDGAKACERWWFS